MIVPMRQIELIGHREDLDRALALLQDQPVAEVVLPRGVAPAALVDPRLRAELAQVEGLLRRLLDPGAAAAGHPERTTVIGSWGEIEALRLRLPDLAASVATFDERNEQLRAEGEQLRSSVDLLAGLSDLVPELAAMTDAELTELDLATVVLLLDDPTGRLVATLAAQLRARLGPLHLLVTTADGGHDATSGPVAAGTVGCLLVLLRNDLEAVEELLGADRISHSSVPEAYAGRSLRGTVAAMRERLPALDAERDRVRRALLDLLEPARPDLVRLRRELAAAIERQEAAAAADLTERTFALRLWVPRPAESGLAARLAAALPSLVLAPVARSRTVGQPPVLLQQSRRSWRPYERLVGFLSWPSPQGVDPSGLMAVALPFLFGVMVGDIVYGSVLAGLGWWATRRWRDRPLVVDAGKILLAGGLWATFFGVLFGEALGSLGNSLGLPALWFYRGGPAALEPLLLFALALGAAHIVLGLLLGIWSAIRARQRSLLIERAGTLIVLVGLFILVGAVARLLPTGLLTPAVLLMLIGLVVASVSHGALGLLLGPLELLGTLGNILSYLRVAAVGLASVYLAHVANELARNAPLVLGVLVALLLHLLNLALAAFSPTVQALRLHYVEFFSKFHDGGGRPFRPLGADLPPVGAGSARPAASSAAEPAAPSPSLAPISATPR